jgi:hypothetical protein
MKIDMSNKEIMKEFKINKKNFYAITKIYKNPHNMRFLASILKGQTNSLITVKNEIARFKERYTIEVFKGGMTEEEFAKKENIDLQELKIYRKIQYKRKKTLELKSSIEEEMKEFLEVLDINSCVDLVGIDKKISQELHSKSLENFNESKDFSPNVELYIYARKEMLKTYFYSSEFYPFEDIILKQYYPEIGIKILEVLSKSVENYKIRPLKEYISRLRELEVKKEIKVPYQLQFGLTGLDESLIDLFYENNLSYVLPWLTQKEMELYYEKTGKGDFKSEYEDFSEFHNKIVDELKIRKTTNEILKLKEVKYHDEYWTSKKYNLLKKEFKKKGFAVKQYFPEIPEKELELKIEQFGFFREYTKKEKKRISNIYVEKGMYGVQKAFPNRTLRDLKHQLEELGLEKFDIINDEVVEENVTYHQIKNKVKQEIHDKIYQKELKKIKRQVIAHERKRIEMEIAKEMYDKGFQEATNHFEIKEKHRLRNEMLNQFRNEGHHIIDNCLGVIIRKDISNSINNTRPMDYHKKLADRIYKNISHNFKREIDKMFKSN